MAALATRLEEATRAEEAKQRRYIASVNRTIKARDRLTDRQVIDALGLLDDARRRVVDDLTRIASTGGTEASITTLTAMRDSISAAAADFVRRFSVQHGQGLADMFDLGVSVLPTALDAIHVDAHLRPEVSRTQLAAVLQIGADMVVKVGQDFRDRTTRTVQMGVLGGKSISQMMKDVQADLRTQPARANPKLGTIAYQAERIVRTELGRSFAIGNQMRSDEIAEATPGLLKFWRTAGDHRVRDSHVIAGRTYAPGGSVGPIPHAQAFTVGGTKMQYPHDPAGGAHQVINCRCHLVDYHPDWFGEIEPEIATPPEPEPAAPTLEAPTDQPYPKKGFSSLEAAQNWMGAKYPDVQFDFLGNPATSTAPTVQELGEEIFRTLDRLWKDWPYVRDRVRYVGTYGDRSKLPNPDGAEKMDGPNPPYAHAYYDGTQMGFNHRQISDLQTFRDSREYDAAIHWTAGWRLKDPTDRSWVRMLTTHEFGHWIDGWMQGSGAGGGSKLSIHRGVRAEGLSLLGTMNSAFKMNQQLAPKELSMYSNTNLAESWAESFAALENLPQKEWTAYTKKHAALLKMVRGARLYTPEEWKWFRDFTEEERTQWLEDPAHSYTELVKKWKQAGVWN